MGIKMDKAIEDIDKRVITLDTSKTDNIKDKNVKNKKSKRKYGKIDWSKCSDTRTPV